MTTPIPMAMRRLLLLAIRLYQRYVSPHKGFCCAYRSHTGRAGCSALGYRAVRRHGVLGGLKLLRRRTRLCGVAHRRFGPAVLRPAVAQRGDCDCSGCDCDLPASKSLVRWCDVSGCCEGDSGGTEQTRKKRARRDQQTHLPPKRQAV